MTSRVLDEALRCFESVGTTMKAAALRAGFSEGMVRTMKVRKNSALANFERLLLANGFELRVVRKK